MKILITGFAPFGGQTVNPAYEAVRILPDTVGGAALIKAELPVVFRKAGEVLYELMDRCRPDAVILVGQAGGRDAISLERVAINVMDASAPDNEGNLPVDEPVAEDGPAAYFSTLPLRAMEEAILNKEIPCRISNTAGTYVCNDLMYRLLHKAAREGLKIPAGFIHVPYLPEQTDPSMPSMPLEMIAGALETAVEVLVQA